MEDIYDVVIIGSGPAGLSAAIYTSRAGLKTLVVTGMPWGGNLMITSEVENYPGFPKLVPGAEIGTRIREQAERLGAEMLETTVTEVLLEKSQFTLKTQANKDIKAKSVIAATGAKPKKLGVPGEKKFFGRGVSVCATCDGAFYQDKVVGVVGGGDTAIEEAIFLTKFAKKVYVIHRRDTLRAIQSLQDRAKNNDKMEFVWDSEVQEIVGSQTVEKVVLENNKTGQSRELILDGLFVAIGYIPQTELFKDKLELDEWGFIKLTKAKGSETSVSGVFAAGDVADPHYQQIVTAAGMGAKAGIDAQHFLENNA